MNNSSEEENSGSATNGTPDDVTLEKIPASYHNDNYVNCKNCKWNGKKTALLKHLRMKSECKSIYNMKELNAEHDEIRKRKKKHYNASHYAKNRVNIKRYNQANKVERKAYKQNYDAKHKTEIQDYMKNCYHANREERIQYQRQYDELHKDRKKRYKKLKAHYRKYDNGRMEHIFQKYNISHFKSHIEGWCDWTSHQSSHDYCWEKVQKLCAFCQENLFMFKSIGSYEINGLHCLTCCGVTCNLCGASIKDFKYYEHFYMKGINSDLKEKANLCPYRTHLESDDETLRYTPCEICSNDEAKASTNSCIVRVGVKYRYFVNEKTFETTSIMTNGGRDIFTCPYNNEEEQSTICLKEAIQKLCKKVNYGKPQFSSEIKDGIREWNPEYIWLWEYKYSRHKTEFNLMCELKRHMDLHTSRVETHVIELTLVTPYTTQSDLDVIDTLIKINIENLEGVSKIEAIIPANKCLGLQSHLMAYAERQEPWLAYINPKDITHPVPSNTSDIKGPDGKLLTTLWEPPIKHRENLVKISQEMTRIIEGKKKLFMIIHTNEGAIENPMEFFEEIPIFPEWVQEVKLLFTWSVKSILEEERKSIQKSLIQADYIQSKKYPSYIMNLPQSNICNCDCCSRKHMGGISSRHTIPVSDCSLPIKMSPLQDLPLSMKSGEWLWESMFKFAWKILQPSNESDSSETFDSETECELSANDNDDNEDSEDSNYCDDL